MKHLIAIEAIQSEIELLQAQIDGFEIDESKYTEQYDDTLNECHEEVFNILPSRILSECDPIAYACGLSDYVGSLDVEEDESYKLLIEEKEELEYNVELLKGAK